MKKIAKISLVAAIAVAGFTTANAQPLEEAIKNVDVTGSVVYRYNDYSNEAGRAGLDSDNTNTNNYKVALGLASKVNEDVKFNSRFVVGSSTTAGFVELDSNGHDGQADVTLSHANFAYTGIKNTTVIAGKQGLTTPWTVAVDSDNNEQTGTGILALSALGPVTLAGAYFNQTNLDLSADSKFGDGTALAGAVPGNLDIATVGAIATVGPVTGDAWFLDMSDTFDTYTVGAKATTKLGSVDLGADTRFASLTFDGTDEKANTMAKIVLTADAGLVDGKLAYAMTDKDGGLTALDNDATTTLLGWNLALNGKANADYYQAVLGFDILSNLNLSANYGNLQYAKTETVSTTDIEEEEVYAQLLYKMSKNLSTYVRYGTYSKEETATVSGTVTEKNDDTRGRLQVEYTF